jgi:xanthine dehydrogenase YagS FAD-binding subunit
MIQTQSHRSIDLPLNSIESRPDGTLRIGAMVRDCDLAWNTVVRRDYPILSEAVISSMSSPGHNQLPAARFSRERCMATHPSDICVALAALDAVVRITGSSGRRDVPIEDFYLARGYDPRRLNALNSGDMITHIDLPAMPDGRYSHYVKLRDRISHHFALASAGVWLDLDGSTICDARVVLGGIAAKPWRSIEAETTLVGQEVGTELFEAAADEAMKDGRQREFKPAVSDLARRTLALALAETALLHEWQ